MIQNLICAVIEFDPDGVLIFGYKIYFYALLITTGMICAIVIASKLMKKKGIPGDQSLDYAILVIPLAIIGCRIYFLLFPYSNISYEQFEASWSWQNFWAIRNGGLGIYGGVILGYISVFIMTRIKKLKFFEIGDSIIPGLLLAQSIGRWGNFVNGEAYGNLVTNPDLQFFPYAVFADGAWHQATFFYESMFTLIGFFVCLMLIKDEHYRDGWCMSFYGLYYGLVRLVIEGMRTDSLFLRVPIIWERTFWETGIRISQLVSICIMVFSVVRLGIIYRKELKDFWHRLRNKKPKSNA
ncbi:MAG TPA: prolipoprotein diacylglyceryl transferase [Clostridia bacterium]|nr:prolipoprotein diacylglyceryl transferase [Clostridia bacterium]